MTLQNSSTSTYLLVDFRAVATYEKTVHDHRTGRKCALCGGVLMDTIINFGEFLRDKELSSAYDHAKKSDLCLVLGSSLTIPPANKIPDIVGKKKKAELVICNLQSTPLDHLSKLRVYSKADALMVRVMEKLEIPIPTFILHRRLVVELETKDARHQLKVQGVDVDGTPATFLQSVKLEYNRRIVRAEPFVIKFRGDVEPGTELILELEFMGHYAEPNLEIVYEFSSEADRQTSLYLLEYNPHSGEWKTSKQENPADNDDEMADKLVANASVIDLT